MKTTQKQIAERTLSQALSDSGAKGAFSLEILTTVAQVLEAKAENDDVENPAVLDALAAVVFHMHRFYDLDVERYLATVIEERLIALGKAHNIKV